MFMCPHFTVIATAFAVLLIDLFLQERQRWLLGTVTAGGLVLAFLAAVMTPIHGGAMFGGRFEANAVTWWFNIIFILAALVTVIISMDMVNGNAKVRVRGMGARGEYFAVMLFTLTGMMYFAAARDLVTFYVSLELATIPMFALASWRREDAKSGEAGLKYVILAMISSSLMLYGLALIYGLSGTSSLTHLALAKQSPLLWFAVALVLAGAGAKFTVAPFHFWAADVYEGAPTPITAYLSVASKCTGLVFMFQFMFVFFSEWLSNMGFLFASIAAITMTIGNTVAIVQTNIKRFMAFSSISQAGYFLMGFLSPQAPAVPALLYYMLIYLVSNMGVFTAIIWYANETGREDIDEYHGLSRTNPLMALMMMVCLFSLAGIPPLSGFVGKFFLFSIASSAGYHWLVAVAAVNSTISLYYYLRVVRQMYIEPVYPDAQFIPVPKKMVWTEGFLFAAVLLLGIVPTLYEHIHADTVGWFAALPK